MGKFKYLLVILLGVLFLVCPQIVRAEDLPTQEIVINELMWMGSSKSASDEWIELYNMTSQRIDLSGWKISYLDSTGTEKFLPSISAKFIKPNDYFLISHYSKGESSILNIKPDLVLSGLTLSNTNLQIKLYDSFDQLIDVAGDGHKPLNGNYIKDQKWQSMERNEIPGVGTTASSWYPATTSLNLLPGLLDQATPERSFNQAPAIAKINSPLDGTNIIEGSNIIFLWEAIDPDGDSLSTQILLDCNGGFKSSPLLNEENIIDSSFTLTTQEVKEGLGECLSYYWMLNVSDGDLNMSSDAVSFTISKPVYSKEIIINEILPHPQNGSDYEFIELYNSGTEEVDISDWYLDDAEDGGSFPIPVDTTIKPGEYIAFYKNTIEPKTHISLNDEGDSARLLFPNKQVAFPRFYDEPCSYDKYAPVGLALARTAGGTWAWTTQPTAGGLNIITSPIIEDAGGDEEEIKIPINDEPIEIQTGDIANYRDYLVTVSGEITRTSGNTFYVDDGSGEIKVYIQEKTGIDKPEMHTGDIFEIVGIVNLYRNTWRLLPQKQDDIKLIEAIKKTNISASKTTTSKKTTSSQTVSANTKARAPTSVKQVQAAEDTSRETSTASSFWINFVKMMIGLAIILLIIFVLKLRAIKKEKPIGADFGDDLT